VRIGHSRISTGKNGYETPTGSFKILQKRKKHKSNLYENGDMPFMQRLTWDGIALHGGRVPDYPASHGCIRFPHNFASKLYGITRIGSQVVIQNYHPGDEAISG
jgi:lipoprotein-anchoring transpeptidase ErfK/SrfK